MKTTDADVLIARKTSRNDVTEKLRAEKYRYHVHLFHSCKGRRQDIWEKLNTVLGTSTDPLTKRKKNDVILEGEVLHNAFNDFFLSLPSA